MPTFGDFFKLFYFVGREGYVRKGVCGNAPRTVLQCYIIICIMVDHQLLNVGNHHHTHAIYLSRPILVIPAWTNTIGICIYILGIRCHTKARRSENTNLAV